MIEFTSEMVICGAIMFFCFGMTFAVLCLRPTKKKIIETRELIIEACIDHAYVEESRSEGDYDINVSRKGEEKVDKILGSL